MMQLEALFEKVKYNALDYIGLYQTPVSELSQVLETVATQNGSEIFQDPEGLRLAMRESGADEAEICRVCLMTQVAGFRELMARDARTTQLDLDRYIQNAARETGFNRDTVLRLTSAMAYAVGIAMNRQEAGMPAEETTTETVAALAYAVCREELEKFRVVFDRQRISPEEFEALEPLVNIGIPKAKYYMGYCLLYGVGVEINEEQGVALLQQAADAGDSQAAATLGDYYFARGGSDNWSAAYDLYTGFGAVALNSVRKKAVVSILNHKRFNRKLLGWCVVLFLGLLATVIWAPAAGLFALRPFWGYAAVAVQLGLLVVQLLHYRVKPYDCVYHLPVAMSAVWFLYMVIRLVF